MSLSEAAQTAFDTWPEWRLPLNDPPTIIRRLTGGLTNELFLLKAAGLRLVLRVNHEDGESLGIDRQREQQILDLIQGKAFAPVVFHCDATKRVLVTEYIEGYQWQPDELADPLKADSLVDLITQIHNVKQGVPLFDYEAHLRSYWQRLLESDQPFPMSALKLYKNIEAGLPEFQGAIKDPVLCHHDLIPANIIEQGEGQLVVLDWEYAGGGSALVDAMGVARYWQNPELTARITDQGVAEETQQLARDIVNFYEMAWLLLR